ncbi:hypothetical protein KEJ34_02180 [Candidatus Bathyarchaeota archaeon]|nr:hypothetical protein [Candidatus Bathyarchaeota archaeon]
MSNGETNGIYATCWKKFFPETNMNSANENIKYESKPIMSINCELLLYTIFMRDLARKVDGCGSKLYLNGKPAENPAKAGSKERITSTSIVAFSHNLLYKEFIIDMEIFRKRSMKIKRIIMENIINVERGFMLREYTVAPNNMKIGWMKGRDSVKSASKLAKRNFLGVTGDVKIKLCSYSNAVQPLKANRRITLMKPLMTAARFSTYRSIFAFSCLTALVIIDEKPNTLGRKPKAYRASKARLVLDALNDPKNTLSLSL